MDQSEADSIRRFLPKAGHYCAQDRLPLEAASDHVLERLQWRPLACSVSEGPGEALEGGPNTLDAPDDLVDVARFDGVRRCQ
jgi:hypothetical protein